MSSSELTINPASEYNNVKFSISAITAAEKKILNPVVPIVCLRRREVEVGNKPLPSGVGQHRRGRIGLGLIEMGKSISSTRWWA